MVPKKIKSKRQTMKIKFKIKRKVTEHNRKQRREERKNPEYRKKLKKDPGIPNLWPFKEEFLHKLENQKAKMDAEQLKQKEARLSLLQAKRKDTVSSLAANASQREKDFEKRQSEKKEAGLPTAPSSMKEGSKRAYYKEFKKLVQLADVILEVLDARDPLGCRCREVEQKILAKDPNKKIILVLNKIDLIPKDNAETWLKYLRNELPTIAFKCSTQEQKKNLGHGQTSIDSASASMLKSSDCLGADTLVQLLKNYCRNMDIKTSITVGIIGYPNVGKSSLINSLKRSKAVGVGATPGFTKTLQEIHLDKNVKLLDCPGIVFGASTSENDIVLRNAVKIEQIPDPIEPVETILNRCSFQQMMKFYKIAEFGNTTEFLTQIAAKRGKLIKGGRPDLKASARTVLQDWNSGKISFYTLPPSVQDVHVSSAVVAKWGKEFDLDSIMQQEKSYLVQLPSASGRLMMKPGQSIVDAMDSDEEDEEGMGDSEEMESGEEDMEEEATPAPGTTLFQPMVEKGKALARKQNLATEEDLHNPQINQQRRKEQKKAKKQQKKGKALHQEEESDEDYNFADHFPLEPVRDDDIDLDDI